MTSAPKLVLPESLGECLCTYLAVLVAGVEGRSAPWKPMTATKRRRRRSQARPLQRERLSCFTPALWSPLVQTLLS